MHRGGFTLIELVASALLAAMMTAGLMSIVWSAVRESNQLRRSDAGLASVSTLTAQMRIDFYNARGMLVDSSGITLHGFLGRDSRSGQSLMIPGRVRYESSMVAGRRVLLRVVGENSREPVWIGVMTLQIEPLQEFDTDDERLPLAETGGLPEVPIQFRVTMLGEDGRTLWREVIHHHEG